jgi:trehalose synthase
MSPAGFDDFRETISEARDLLAGRRVWNVNSTAKGGGVAEMLVSLLAYARGAGVDARWLVIEGDPEFFTVTKRLHNHLHGAKGDGGELDAAAAAAYEATLTRNAAALTELLEPGDIVLLHDPQTAGLVESAKATGATAIWRCHVGLDTANDVARRAWDFLRPHILDADAYIFSRRAFAWEKLQDDKIVVIPPSIDAFSPKNQELDTGTVAAILSASGLIAGDSDGRPRYLTADGSAGEVTRSALMLGAGPPAKDVPLVVQVSRWDALKDPLGVMEGFVRFVAPHTDAHLVLAGPSVEAVTDDPEGARVLEDAYAQWELLAPGLRERVHLAALPMEDGQENAAIVNALQRRADVVVQKSLAEGFGLTVAEAMWKARPVVASRIGGIQDQIEEGTGVLLDDPADLREFGAAVTALLADREGAEAMGRAAKARVTERFLGPRHLTQYLDLFRSLSAPALREP